MIKSLATGEMKWSNNLDYDHGFEEGNNSFFYEVDLKYPNETKTQSQHYRFRPQKQNPNEEWLSEYQNKYKTKEYEYQEKNTI